MFDGVGAQWRVFDTWLAQVEHDSAADGRHDHHQNEDRMQGQASGERNTIPHLRTSHTHYLDRILFALLLRKRQGQVKALLEEILSLVLRFAWLVGHGAGADSSSATGSGNSEGVSSGMTLRGDDDDNHGQDEPQQEGRGTKDTEVKEKDHAEVMISELHATFKRKTAAFVHLCWDVSLVGMKKKNKKSMKTKEKERRKEEEEEEEEGQGMHDHHHHPHHHHHHDDNLALLIAEGGDEDNDDDEDEDKDEDYAKEAMAALVGRLEMVGF